MLCAFANHNDLRNCLDAVNAALNSDLSDVLVFRAKPRPGAAWLEQDESVTKDSTHAMASERNEEGDSLFAFSIKSSDKVRVLRDWRGMAELRKQFPSIDGSMINDIWKQQQCWQACFDVLSSLVKSHGSIIIEQCDVVIDEIHFPSLSMSAKLVAHPASRLPTDSQQSSRSGSQDWTIITLEQSFSTMSVSSAENDDVDMQKWEMVPSPIQPNQKVEGFSYKDALLKSSPQTITFAEDLPKKRSWSDLANEQSQRKWKPIFVITKVPNVRPDREYVGSMFDLDEEEADMYWDICTNAKIASATSVGAKRIGGVMHMRPAMMDQKLKRIAMKTK